MQLPSALQGDWRDVVISEAQAGKSLAQIHQDKTERAVSDTEKTKSCLYAKMSRRL